MPNKYDISQATVLVVSSDESNRKFLEILLKLNGYEVIIAEDGKEALKKLKENVTSLRYPSVDLILSDVVMLNMGGYKLCQAIQEDENLKYIPVIFINAAREGLDRMIATLDLDVVDYIISPFHNEELLARIRAVLRSSRLMRELRRRNWELAILKEISDIANRSSSLNELLDNILSMILEITRTEKGGIRLLDEENGESFFAAHQGLPEEFIREENRVRLGECLCGQVAQSGEAMIIEDISRISSPDIKVRGVCKLYGFRSLALVPLRAEDKVTGLIFLSPEHRLSSEDMQLLNSIGEQIGKSIAERRGVEERIRYLASVVEHSQNAIFSVDLNGITTSWNKGAEKVYGYQAEEVVGESIEKIVPLSLRGELSEFSEKIRAGEEISHYETRRLTKDQKVIDIDLAISPIKDEGGKIVGFSAIARDISERKRDEMEIRRRNRELSTLNAISSAISRSLELDKILNNALDEVLKVMEMEAGAIYILDEEAQELRIATSQGFNAEYIKETDHLKIGEGFTGRVVLSGEPLVVENVSSDPRLTRMIAKREGLQSLATVPLMSKGKTLGTMGVITHNYRKFTPEEMQLLTAIGNQIGVAIEDARLFASVSEKARRMTLLNYTTDKLLKLTSLEEKLDLIMQGVKELGFDRGWLAFVDEEENMLVGRSGFGEGLIPETIYTKTPLDLHPSGISIREKKPILVKDPLNDPRWSEYIKGIMRALGTKSYASVPIIAGDEAIGVITADYFATDKSITEEDLQLLSTFAYQASLAIENAGLFDSVSEKARRMTLLNYTTEKLLKLTSLEEKLDLIMQGVKELGFDRGWLALVDEEEKVLVGQAGFGEKMTEEMIYSKLPLDSQDLAPSVATVIEKRPILVKDPLDDPRWSEGAKEVWRAVGMKSLASVPIIAGDKAIGIITADYFATDKSITEEDLQLLSTFAYQASLAIESARYLIDLEKEKGELEAILNSTGDAIIAVDEQGRVLMANPAFGEAFDIKVKEIIGLPIHSIKNDSLQKLCAMVDETEGLTKELTLDSEKTFLVTISPVEDSKGNKIGCMAVLQDISYLKELDEMKTEFLFSASHDLKLPLSSIISYADVLASGMMGELDYKQREFLEVIIRSADNMSNLITDILDIVRIESGIKITMELCQLDLIIKESILDFKHLIRDKGLELRSSIPPLPKVWGNKIRLKQAISNLLSNAIRYTSKGTISIEAKEEQGYITVSVRDTGIGIAAGDQPYIFDKFYRIKDKKTRDIKGTGLGLSIVKSVVERHGGTVGAESKVGEGSSFYFTLPVYKAD